MKKIIKLFVILMMIAISSPAQEMLTTETFNKETSRGIIVVEFWASWNDLNSCIWLEKLKECEVYRVDIGTYIDLQKEFEITAIPTIIIFNNGNVEETYTANIMFQLEADKNKIQAKVDEIILKQFE